MMHLSMVIVNNAESNILKSPVEGLNYHELNLNKKTAVAVPKFAVPLTV